jgi:hypothetical protein
MKSFFTIALILTIFSLFSQNLMSIDYEETNPIILNDGKIGDVTLGAGWYQTFYEENFYQHFDYFKVWMKTELNGDMNEHHNKNGEYPVTENEFYIGTGTGTDACFYDVHGRGWSVLTNNGKMFEAVAPSTGYWRTDNFYFNLYFKDANKAKKMTFYFAAYDTKSYPGNKELKNFCAIHWDGSKWWCNNYDRPVNQPDNPAQGEYLWLNQIFQQIYNTTSNPLSKISYWPFDECQGNIAFDEGAKNYDGLIVGAQRVQGFNGGGLNFNGSNLVDIGNVSEFNFAFDKPFTVAAWVKFNPWGDFGDFICKMSPPSQDYRGWGLGAGNFGTYCPGNTVAGIRFDLNDVWSGKAVVLDVPGTNNTYWYNGSNQVANKNGNTNGWGDGNWHFVVATYTGKNYDPVLKKADPKDLIVYIDGANASGCRYNGTTVQTMINNANMRIGYRNSQDPNRGFKGMIDEVYAFNRALTPLEQATLFAYYPSNPELRISSCTQDFEPTLVLDLDPIYATDNNGAGINTNGIAVKTLPDMTSIKEDAVMTNLKRQPKFEKAVFGEYRPGIKFEFDYAPDKYGYSDIMESPYHKEITSGVTNKWNPADPEDDEAESFTSKTLLVEFKVGASINQNPPDPVPYYSDGRQTICEFGGPLSGFNIYISKGYLCYGIWNRFERVYIQYNGNNPSFYPLDRNSIYLANLQFDSENLKFRVSVSKSGGTLPTWSDWVSFKGVTKDAEDWSGIGGACRTAYYDYSIGSTYSDHFGGYIGGVWLFNELLVEEDLNGYYNILGNLLGSGYTFPVPAYPSTPKETDGDWLVFNEVISPEGKQVSEAFPNPFATRTSFGVYIDAQQYVLIELFDAHGSRIQTIFAGLLNKGVHDFTIDGTSLSSGMYLYKVTGADFVQTGKVILNK